MKTRNDLTSACRYCRFYNPEGRRGGMCEQLGVPVRGAWKSCSLAIPAFSPTWETLEEIMSLPEEAIKLEEALNSPCSANISEKNLTPETASNTSLAV